jgi:hypothetical protein
MTMDTLAARAAEALASANALDQNAVAAAARLRSLRGSVEAIDHQCDGAFERFTDVVDAFQNDLEHQLTVVDQAGEEGLRALAEARAQVEANALGAEEALKPALEGADALREHVQAAQSELVPWWDDLEEAAQAMIESARKAQADLEAAVAEARQFMEDEVADALRQLQDAVRTRGADWRDELREQSRVPAQDDVDDWSLRLEEVASTLEESFTGAVTHTGEVATFVIAELKDACDDAIRELDALSDPVVAQLQEAKAHADKVRTDTDGASDALDRDVEETVDLVNDATSKFLEVIGTLMKYTFVVL